MIKPTRPRSTPRKPAAANASVLAHRLFPASTGLWFAALFGLGGLVAGSDAIAVLVSHLHLAAIVPAAAPPLGTTARLLIVLALAGLGGVLGLACGWLLHARVAHRSPTVVQPVAPAPRSQPAPPTDEAPRVRNRDAHPDAPPRRPLVVTEDVLPYPTAVREPETAFVPYARDQEQPAFDMPAFLAAEPEQPVATDARRAPLTSQAAAAPHAPLGEAALDSLGLVQLIERLALAIARRQARPAAVAAPEIIPVGGLVDPGMPLHRFDASTMDPPGPLLQIKRPRSDQANPPRVSDVLDPGGRLHDPIGDIADWGDPDHDADLPPRFLGVQPSHEEPSEAPEPEIVEDRYSSLADMAMPRPALVMPEPQEFEHRAAASDGPDQVVRFPQRSAPAGPHETAPGDADNALREALATLRRMSASR